MSANGLKIREKFTFPLFAGSADPTTSAMSVLVPGKYDIALDGRPYMLDTTDQSWGDQSIQRTRAQADNSPLPSERSLNPDGTWRRSQESWTGGAGQRFLDAEDSVPERFWASKGIDCWTRGRISLLHETAAKFTSDETVLDLAPCNDRLYLLAGDSLSFTADVTVAEPDWTEIDIGEATPCASITADGKNVYLAADDVYYTDSIGTAFQTACTSPFPADLVRYVKGRLLVAKDNVWDELSGTLGSLAPLDAEPIFTHPNPDFTWADFIGGTSQIYAAGYSGDKSLIYRTEIWQDGTGLTAPVVAAELPDGEIVSSLGVYLGFVLIGTSKGVRFAVPNTQGDLEVGQLLATAGAVHAFEGQDRFVWFGWSNYDSESTGLGRLDLSTFNELAPAYASDLMADGQGAVTDVVTFQGIRVFTVAGHGVFGETTSLVDFGQLDSGWFSYQITEPKTALKLDSQWAAGAGTIQPSFAVDEGTFETVGATIAATSRAGSTTASLRQRRGRLFEVRLELARDLNDGTLGPTLVRWTTRSQQASQPGVLRRIPLRLHRQIVTVDDDLATLDIQVERGRLEEMHRSTRPILFQQGVASAQVVLEDWEWHPYRPEGAPKFSVDGTFVAYLKELV